MRLLKEFQCKLNQYLGLNFRYIDSLRTSSAGFDLVLYAVVLSDFFIESCCVDKNFTRLVIGNNETVSFGFVVEFNFTSFHKIKSIRNQLTNYG